MPFMPCFSTITVAGKDLNGKILISKIEVMMRKLRRIDTLSAEAKLLQGSITGVRDIYIVVV